MRSIAPWGSYAILIIMLVIFTLLDIAQASSFTSLVGRGHRPAKRLFSAMEMEMETKKASISGEGLKKDLTPVHKDTSTTKSDIYSEDHSAKQAETKGSDTNQSEKNSDSGQSTESNNEGSEDLKGVKDLSFPFTGSFSHSKDDNGQTSKGSDTSQEDTSKSTSKASPSVNDDDGTSTINESTGKDVSETNNTGQNSEAKSNASSTDQPATSKTGSKSTSGDDDTTNASKKESTSNGSQSQSSNDKPDSSSSDGKGLILSKSSDKEASSKSESTSDGIVTLPSNASASSDDTSSSTDQSKSAGKGSTSSGKEGSPADDLSSTGKKSETNNGSAVGGKEATSSDKSNSASSGSSLDKQGDKTNNDSSGNSDTLLGGTTKPLLKGGAVGSLTNSSNDSSSSTYSSSPGSNSNAPADATADTSSSSNSKDTFSSTASSDSNNQGTTGGLVHGLISSKSKDKEGSSDGGLLNLGGSNTTHHHDGIPVAANITALNGGAIVSVGGSKDPSTTGTDEPSSTNGGATTSSDPSNPATADPTSPPAANSTSDPSPGTTSTASSSEIQGGSGNGTISSASGSHSSESSDQSGSSTHQSDPQPAQTTGTEPTTKAGQAFSYANTHQLLLPEATSTDKGASSNQQTDPASVSSPGSGGPAPAQAGNVQKPLSATTPSTIVPQGADNLQQLPDMILIALLFKPVLSWSFLSGSPETVAQIFLYMPSIVAEAVGMSVANITTIRLQVYTPLDGSLSKRAEISSDDLSGQSLYLAYVPSSVAPELKDKIKDTSSNFYTLPVNPVAMSLAENINPGYDILQLSTLGDANQVASKQSDQTSTGNSKSNSLRNALIGVATALGFCIFVFVLWRVWKKHQKTSRRGATQSIMARGAAQRGTIHSFGATGNSLRETWAPSILEQERVLHGQQAETWEHNDNIHSQQAPMTYAPDMAFIGGLGTNPTSQGPFNSAVTNRSSQETERSGGDNPQRNTLLSHLSSFDNRSTRSGNSHLTEAQRIQQDYVEARGGTSNNQHSEQSLSTIRYQDEYERPRQNTQSHINGLMTGENRFRSAESRESLSSASIGRPEMQCNSMCI